MAYWTGTEIEYFSPRKTYCKHWLYVDCVCCMGIKWGGEEPVECSDCGGSGYRAVHLLSGVIALWPKGPLCGKLTNEELHQLQRSADTL
jgi:hypothetical protein